MHSIVIRYVLTFVLSLVAFVFVFQTAFAATHTLGGTHSKGDILTHCNDSNGQYFESAKGSYGCATSAGTVQCSSKGKCTGTCQKCKTTGEGNPVKGILHGGNVGAKSGDSGSAPPKSDSPGKLGGTKTTSGSKH